MVITPFNEFNKINVIHASNKQYLFISLLKTKTKERI